MADSSFVQWIYQIWDFSRIEGVDFSMDQMRGFAIQDAAAAEKNPNQKIAIIPRRSDTSGLDNVFHILEDVWGGYESRTLPDVESARAWGCHASK
ncbi:MAG TPA: hypothetical protein PKH07_17020 [bacterium]|nr:hypothetical protein [bacterium]